MQAAVKVWHFRLYERQVDDHAFSGLRKFAVEAILTVSAFVLIALEV